MHQIRPFYLDTSLRAQTYPLAPSKQDTAAYLRQPHTLNHDSHKLHINIVDALKYTHRVVGVPRRAETWTGWSR